MKKVLLSFIVFYVLPIWGICQDNAHIKIGIIYDVPIDGYTVSGYFYPFDAVCETGWVELHFVPIEGGKELVFSNVGRSEEGHPEWPEKFTGKNIYDRLFQNGTRVPFVDGETLHCTYHQTKGSFENSPLYYDAEFQFYDVDFDGQDEFLINDYYMGRGGNNYTVYEITPNGFVKKTMEPFDDITNSTVFNPEKRTITNTIDFYSGEKEEYTISKDGNRVIKKVKIEGIR